MVFGVNFLQLKRQKYFLFVLMIHFQAYSQLAGEYSIGKSPGNDFSSIFQAVDSLHMQGISAPVVFKIEKGIYTGQITLLPVSGADSVNTITFESQSTDSQDVVIESRSYYAYSNFVMNILGADYIRFRKISFKALSDTFSRLILINGNAVNIKFESCVFSGKRPNSSFYPGSSDQTLVISQPASMSVNQQITFLNCLFRQGYYALEFNGYSKTQPEKNINLEKCRFVNQFFGVLSCDLIQDLTVKGCHFENNTSDYFSGIVLNSVTGINISGNLFYSTSCYSGEIISLFNCSGNSQKRILIFNNVVNYFSPSVYYQINQLHTAFYLNNCDSVEIYHNTIQVNGKNKKSKLLMAENCKNLIILNNIFSNTAGGFIYYFSDKHGAGWSIQNNILYSSADYPFFELASEMNFDQWKKYSSFDSVSVFIIPDFYDPVFLRTKSILINNKAINTNIVVFDFDGEKRQTFYPDPGAFEFDPFKYDLEMNSIIAPDDYYFCQESDSLKLTFRIVNKGLSSLKGSNFVFKTNNYSFTDSFYIADTLYSYDTLVFSLQKYLYLPADGKVEALAIIKNFFDENNFNDTLRITFQAVFKIESFPFYENFDDGHSPYFSFLSRDEASVAITDRSAYSGKYSLHFQGRSLNQGWIGNYNATTDENAWNDNYLHHAFVQSCRIIPGEHHHLRLSLKLRQTYSYDPLYSWFRILVNDSIVLKDIDGNKNFNPLSDSDNFRQLCFDLSPYCGSSFHLTLGSSCRTFDKYYREGDNVFVDDFIIQDISQFDACILKMFSPFNSICADSFVPLIVTIRNNGYDTLKNIVLSAVILKNQQSQSLCDTMKQILLPGEKKNILIGYVDLSSAGAYNFTIIASNPEDTTRTNDTLRQEFVVNQTLPLPVVENFDQANSLKNWKIKNMWVSYPGHHNAPSYCLSNSIWTQDSTGFADFNSLIGPVTKNTYLSFDYRIVSNLFPFTGRQLTSYDSLKIMLTDNCKQEPAVFFVIDSTNHVISDQMKRVVLPLRQFEGKMISFGFRISSDSFNMSYVDIDSVVIAELPEAFAGKDTALCPGNKVQFRALPCHGCNYQWINFETNTFISDSLSMTTDIPGKYILKVTDQKGWSNMDTVELKMLPLPEVSAGPDRFACVGDSIILTANGAEKYRWDDAFDTNQLKIKIIESTFHYVTGIGANGCLTNDTVWVYALGRPSVEIIGPDSVCKDVLYHYTAYGAMHYSWNNSFSGDSASISFHNDSVLVVVGTDQFGCTDTAGKIVRVKSLPMPDLGRDTVLCSDQKIVLYPGIFQKYLWYDQSSSANKIIDSTGVGEDTLIAWVIVWQDGCFNSDTVKIVFVRCSSQNEEFPYKIDYFPNPFTDRLFISLSGFNGKTMLTVFDNHGKMLSGTRMQEYPVILDFSGLPAGIYWIEIKNEHYWKIVKALKAM